MTRDQIVDEGRSLDQRPGPGAERLRLFVPVDFSHGSYNALEYAMRLAKMCNGEIDLLHAIDINELPDSENPLNIRDALARTEARAYRKLTSLVELIESDGVVVGNRVVQVGNAGDLVRNYIKATSPDLAVVGMATKMSKLLAGGKNAISATLIVPPSIKLSSPAKILLIRDNKTIHERVLKPLATLVHNGSNTLTILDAKLDPVRKIFRYILPIGGFEIQTKRYNYLTPERSEFSRFIADHKPDLICEILHPPTVWDQFFAFFFKNRRQVQYDIPTLIIPTG